MKYPVWFLRLLFAAWMIPAGLNHFVPIFPQPMGSQPLSQELIIALLDSHLFDLVKGVELLAGIFVLFGLFTPLALLICLPVSFGVFYWDAPLEGWGSGAALFGYATLLTNSLLCLAYYKSYQSMFTLRAEVAERKQLVLIARIVFGVGIILFAANILFLSPAPTGTEPLATLLMTSLVNSKLLYVALSIQLLAGAFILAGIFIPLALTVQMAITTNALFWSLFLNHEPIGGILTLIVFALYGLLMLAYLPYYKDVLQENSLAAGEEAGKSYDNLFISPNGQTSRENFIPALITVLVAFAFYNFMIAGRSVDFSKLVLMYPLFILLIRRFRDMGQTPWLLFAPLLTVLLAFDVQLEYFTLGETLDGLINNLALVIAAAFILWGGVNLGKSSPSGEP